MHETYSTTFILIQAIGFAAFLVGVASYQFKDQLTMFGFRVAGDGVWALHYGLLGATSPALTVFIAFLRTFLVVFVCPKHKKTIVIAAILAVALVCGVTYDGYWPSLLPALTAVFYGLSTYYHEDYVKSRLFMAFGALFWIMIGFFFHSYAEMVSSSLSFVSILVGYGRHRRRGLHMQV